MTLPIDNLARQRPLPPPGQWLREFMAALLEQLDLSCVSLGPGCRNLDTDLAPGSGLIEEIDFFGVGNRIESRRLDGFFPQVFGDFQGRRLLAAAVNGPFRVPYPESPTLVLHLTIWPEKWLTKVCPFVVNGFRRAQVFVGKKPDSFVPMQRPEPKELLNWHYGLKNCRRYIDQEGFEAPTWWLAGRPCDGKIMFHDISGSYRMTEFIAYSLNSALANIGQFPALRPPSTEQVRLLAAEFRQRAVAARNGAPVDPAWLAKKKPAAVSLIERLIEELQAAL